MSEGRDTMVVGSAEELWRPKTRRDFLRILGIGGTVVMLPSLFACNDDDNNNGTGTTTPTTVTLNLGTDVGILNYAFALEQLEAAFYTAVVASAAFGGMTAEQKEVMVDLRNHEVIHREFFRAAIPTSSRIADLALNASTAAAVTADTATILKTAEAFEDLGVSAYNGAGKYLQSADYLTLAGKIVSVEARHAAAIRDLREGLNLAGTAAGTRFAGDDVVNANGLDVALEPNLVLARVTAVNIVDQTKTPIKTTGTLQSTATFGPPNPTP